METGLSEFSVARIISNAPSRYKTYLIDKKSGGKRLIAQPSREVKLLQRAFMRLVLAHLPVHEAAKAYQEGVSLLDNALPHAGSGPILKMDLRNFFPSIRGRDWTRYCRVNSVQLDAEDVRLSTSLMFFRAKGTSVLKLAIGAPSSPMLSNILMYEFDTSILEAVSVSSRGNVTYTRYADDLTFSAPRAGYLNHVQTDVSLVIRGMEYPKLDINSHKTTEITSKYHRVVTGLTLANDGRVTIGRERKRQISAAVHASQHNKLSARQLKELAGLLAFVNAVEPQFLETLTRKYSDEVIRNIQTTGREARLAYLAR